MHKTGQSIKQIEFQLRLSNCKSLENIVAAKDDKDVHLGQLKRGKAEKKRKLALKRRPSFRKKSVSPPSLE